MFGETTMFKPSNVKNRSKIIVNIFKWLFFKKSLVKKDPETSPSANTVLTIYNEKP